MNNKQEYKDFRQNEGFYFDNGYLYKIKGEETINQLNRDCQFFCVNKSFRLIDSLTVF